MILVVLLCLDMKRFQFDYFLQTVFVVYMPSMMKKNWKYSLWRVFGCEVN